jgi:hypothetical protein
MSTDPLSLFSFSHQTSLNSSQKSQNSLSVALSVLKEKPIASQRSILAEDLSDEVHEELRDLGSHQATKDELVKKLKMTRVEQKKWEHSPQEEKLRAAGIVLIAVILVTLIVASVLISHGAFLASVPWLVAAGVAYIPAKKVFIAYENKKIEFEKFEKWENDLNDSRYEVFLNDFSSRWTLKNRSHLEGEAFKEALIDLHQSVEFFDLWEKYQKGQPDLDLETKIAEKASFIKKGQEPDEETPLLVEDVISTLRQRRDFNSKNT